MSREELGAILGMNTSAVEGIESGRNSNIRADKIKLLCETFHEYPGFLLFGYGHDYWRRLFGPKAEAEINAADGHGDNNILSIVKRSVQETLGSEGLSLLNSIRELNDTGQSRAKMLIDDLLKIEEYQRGT